MTQIATTIEQSNKLIELGIDINTADMYRVNYENKTYLTSMDDEFDKHTDTYAWSLSALIELIPNKISISDDLYYVCYKRNSAELRGPITWNGHQKTKIFKADNILDAVFEMVCYLLENKLI